jgi:hypothetical protein
VLCNAGELLPKLGENFSSARSKTIKSGAQRSGQHNLLERNGGRKRSEEWLAACKSGASQLDSGELYPQDLGKSRRDDQKEATRALEARAPKVDSIRLHRAALNRALHIEWNAAFVLNFTNVVLHKCVRQRRLSHTPSENK